MESAIPGFEAKLGARVELPALAGIASTARAADSKRPLNVMFKSAWGSDDPTTAAFPFLHDNALAEAGHTVQIFLLGEAVSPDLTQWGAKFGSPAIFVSLVERADRIITE